ncbi:kielin/chordin-like protein isoform X1 [Branchiostoma floridae]|uniref:Kielin/chordin-like protein isoform X1 n=2 Tax=Branchiostoma floridae TaxID=7739 RepID=A0A9J7M3D8_BRAFL|nr:kielin/chordin-like protein isoform X1 [Branchiostoma floridae]XP_035692534.1 kielin/chordin-like protein isoform X1 [Branchiostoma floridae]
MLWKLLLATLVMCVAIRETIGRPDPGQGPPAGRGRPFSGRGRPFPGRGRPDRPPGQARKGCWYNDVFIPVGKKHKPDDCTTCTCEAAGAEPECVAIACIALYCPNPEYIPGQCCPVCPPGCMYGDVFIAVGTTYQPDPCTWCSCQEDGGEVACAVVDCARPLCPEPEYIPDRCCPVCPPGCMYGDVFIAVGDTYQPDPCTWCTCEADGAEPQCLAIACAFPLCPEPEYIPDQCCPVCPPGCMYGDVFIAPGNTYQPDPCTWCYCPEDGGPVACAVADCAFPPCSNLVYLPDQCCPVCQDIGCQHADGIILPGEDYKPNPCEGCTCPEAGQDPLCYAMACLEPDCEQPVQVAGQCCPVCDAPDGCLQDNNVIIPVGAEIPQQDPCVVCTCPFAGGTPTCSIIACPAVSCDNPVQIAGQCCPLCNM